MASITIERQGQRVYLVGNTFAAKDRIKAIGGHWDGERRAWWLGAKKAAEVEALVAELNGGAPTAAAAVGLAIDTPAGIVADKLREEGREQEADLVQAAVKPQREDPDNIRLTGKGKYKGRMYYAGSITKDGSRVRLLTLPDAKGDYLDFWAPCSEVEEIKRYEPRQVWDGRRYSGRTVTQHTTLGSIAKFIAREQRNRAAGGDVCAECGKSGELVSDLEDGQLKHRHCCDIEP